MPLPGFNINYAIVHSRLQVPPISYLIPDRVDPAITDVPIDISVHTDTGLPTATVSWTPPTASDNSREGATLTSNYNPGAAFPIGTTTVTYTATDGAGNQATASFNVVVTGKLNPDFHTNIFFLHFL